MSKNKIKKNQLIIQDLEDYLDELGIKNVKPRSNEYNEIHVDRNCKQDDVLSVTPGIESPPYSRLYASLLTAKYMQDLKSKLDLEIDIDLNQNVENEYINDDEEEKESK